MAQCRAMRKDGERCQARARKGSDYCVWHDPARDGVGELENLILHITVVNHAHLTGETDKQSHLDIRLPAVGADRILEVLRRHNCPGLNSRMMFAICRAGILGEILTIRRKNFSICIQIERAD